MRTLKEDQVERGDSSNCLYIFKWYLRKLLLSESEHSLSNLKYLRNVV
jgi:hypothetical protein